MSETTLDEAAQAFSLWRSQRKGKSRTPDHLKAMAISLLARHTISEVCKRLVLNSGTLKSWGGLKKPNMSAPESDFVTLNPSEHRSESNPSGVSLCLSTPGGVDCKLTGNLEPSFVARLIQMLSGGNA